MTSDPATPNNGQIGFIDPCDAGYDGSFERNNSGEIVPLNDIGRYMYRNLCLGLERHSIIWQIDKLLSLRQILKKDIDSGNFTQRINSLLKEQLCLINEEIVIVLEQYKELEH